jgi:replicative DNA helicase
MNAIDDIERNLLGAISRDDRLHYDEAAQWVKSEDFGRESYGRIFRHMGALRASGREINIRLLQLELEKTGELEAVGGYPCLANLDEGLPQTRSVRGWARAIAEASRARRIRKMVERAGAEIDTGSDADAVRDRCISDLLELQAPSELDTSARMLMLLNRMERERNRKTDLLGLPTGLKTLDSVSNGLVPAELTLIGAWTSVGKTSLMVQTMVANARAGNRVLVFSLEMTWGQIYQRMISMVSNVPFVRVRDMRWATPADVAAIHYAASQIMEWPIEVLHCSGIHVDQLAAKARHAIRREDVKLVCVDYVQILRADGKDMRMQVTNASRGLHRIATEEGVPVVVLSQLARFDKTKAERRPHLSDLRESSQLENDGNLIVLLHRPHDEDGVMGSEAELILAKQRDGATGNFPISFSKTTVKFEECKTAPGRVQETAAGD